jgi:tripartite-type tricarboxylate transporter receptor subunit TctC
MTSPGQRLKAFILWRAVLVPKGTPPDQVDKLAAAFEQAVNAPASRKFLQDAGEQVLIRKGAELRDYIDREFDAMRTTARALKLTPQ